MGPISIPKKFANPNAFSEKKIKYLILPYETIGNKIFDSPNFLKKLSYKDVNYQFHVREWDRNALSYAKKGFFNFKKNIPYLLSLSNL